MSDLVVDIELAFPILGLASASIDNRYISKVFRDLGPLRRRIAQTEAPLLVLATIINKAYPTNHPNAVYLKQIVGEPLKIDTEKTTPALGKPAIDNLKDDDAMDVDTETSASTVVETPGASIPEVDLYIHLLVQVVLLDLQKLDVLDKFNAHVVELTQSYNKRSLDFIQAKLWFYIYRTKELLNDNISIRPYMLKALRTATLRHDLETSGSIITLLLRSYLLTHDINQASNLVEKAEFPETSSNALAARYYYYFARINAIQLDYSTSNESLITATRKCPQTHLASGFLKEVTKLKIIIELLMGDIPDLKTFKTEDKAHAEDLEPYFQVTKAVKNGDLKLFEEVLNKYSETLTKENNYTLIQRLRQNVIKTGIRIISLTYSKISLKDICIKLHLDSEELTEYIVGKAIRDGVIEATINHEFGYMQSKELLDIYSTKLPQTEFDQRIKFCLSLHSDSVKAMRYPLDNDHKSESKNTLDSKDEEFDLLKAIEEGDLDDFMD